MMSEQSQGKNPGNFDMMSMIRTQMEKIKSKVRPEKPQESEDHKESENSQSQPVIDEAVLHTVVDQNVGYHCLKLLVMILNTSSKSGQICDERKLELATIMSDQLITLLIEYMDESDSKTKKIVEHILKGIFSLNPQNFDQIKAKLLLGEDHISSENQI